LGREERGEKGDKRTERVGGRGKGAATGILREGRHVALRETIAWARPTLVL